MGASYSDVVVPTQIPATAMVHPAQTFPVPVNGMHQTDVYISPGIPHGLVQALPITSMASLHTPGLNNQLTNYGTQALVPVTAQPLQLHPDMTAVERGV